VTTAHTTVPMGSVRWSRLQPWGLRGVNLEVILTNGGYGPVVAGLRRDGVYHPNAGGDHCRGLGDRGYRDLL